jgi:uncharacterized RDD family membrane protein YckC
VSKEAATGASLPAENLEWCRGEKDRRVFNVFCTKCGSALTADSAFCPTCGAALMRPALASPGAVAVSVPANVGVAGFSAASGGVIYAGFWLRFVAYLIDNLLMSVGLGLIFIPLAIATGALAHFQAIAMSRGGQPDPGAVMGIISLILTFAAISVLLSWLYHAYFESCDWQATPGKRVLSIYVTDVNGQRISFLHATGRFFAKIVSGLIPFAIGYIMAGFTQRKQALHDMIASTLVVRR